MDQSFSAASALVAASQRANTYFALLSGSDASGILDQVFGSGAVAAFQASTLGRTADPLAAVGITVVEGDTLRGHPAAFTAQHLDGNPEILLSADWLRSASSDAITGVLLEEFGHAIDWTLHQELDTPGDEGLIFAQLLSECGQDGLNRAGVNRFDHGLIELNGQQLAVEFATTSGFNTNDWIASTSGDATITTSSAPGQITIQGSNSGSTLAKAANYTTTSVINAPGFAVYDWQFTKNGTDVSTNDDAFGYVTNGTFSRLTDGQGSAIRTDYVNSFFTKPTSFGYRVSTATDTQGGLDATISNFSFTPIGDTYSLRFNQVFSSTLTNGTTFNTGSLTSTNVWIFPENPATDTNYTTTFVNSITNGNTSKQVWLLSPDVNSGQPLALYLTNGQNTVGLGSTAEDLWAFNTAANGTGNYYIMTSGSYTTNASTSVQINSNIELSDLDQLRGEQSDTTPPEVTSVTLNDSCLRIGDTVRATIVFSEAVSGLSNATVSSVLSFPNLSYVNASISTTDNITFTLDFTPATSTEDGTNILSVDATKLSDSSGNIGVNTATRLSTNYSVDTVRPTVELFFDNPLVAGLQSRRTPLILGESPYLYLRFSEPVWNLQLADIIVSGGTISGLESRDQNDSAAEAVTTSKLYRAKFTVSNQVSDSLPLRASLTNFTDRAQASCAAQGNITAQTTDSLANLRHSADTNPPTASFVNPPATTTTGFLTTIRIQLSEASDNFAASDIYLSAGSIQNLRRISPTLYEIDFLPPTKAQTVEMMILTGSFTDRAGNRSKAHILKKDFTKIVVRGLSGTVVGRLR